jgi:hypothetical protein
MQVFIFQSSKDSDIFGFTTDHTGANLPSQFGPWNSIGGHALPAGTGIAGVAGSDVIANALMTHGYYVGRSGGVSVTMSDPEPARPR